MEVMGYGRLKNVSRLESGSGTAGGSENTDFMGGRGKRLLPRFLCF